MGFNIVLVEPEIPTNTGNIGRLCVATGSVLHLVHPLGFEIDDSRVKRAGLDYWPDLEYHEYPSLQDVLSKVAEESAIYFLSAHGDGNLYRQELQSGDWFFFGKESVGLSEEIRTHFRQECIRIPFPGKVRSFNLANAVAMVLGEGMSQGLMDS